MTILLQFVSQRPLTAWILHQFEKPNELFFITFCGYNLAVVKACLPFAITVRWISLLLIHTVLTLTSDLFHQLILPTWKISYLVWLRYFCRKTHIGVCHEVGRMFSRIYMQSTHFSSHIGHFREGKRNRPHLQSAVLYLVFLTFCTYNRSP